jgi:hypothetical protein
MFGPRTCLPTELADDDHEPIDDRIRSLLAAPETSVAAGGGIGGAALDKTKRRPRGYEVPVGFHRNKITSPQRYAPVRATCDPIHS